MKTISVIIPAYNEEKRLKKTLDNWLMSGIKVLEIIVVDDGSTDKTFGIAEDYKKYLPIKTIKISKNQGKGNAVKAGVLASQGDYIFIFDADSAAMAEEIKKLLAEINSYDLVIGSRVAAGARAPMSEKRKFIGKCFHAFCSPLIPGIKDASCGAKLIKKEAAQKIFQEQKIKRFAFDIEILWLAIKMGYKIKEVGIAWKEIPESKVNIARDSWEMFWAVLRIYLRKIWQK